MSRSRTPNPKSSKSSKRKSVLNDKMHEILSMFEMESRATARPVYVHGHTRTFVRHEPVVRKLRFFSDVDRFCDYMLRVRPPVTINDKVHAQLAIERIREAFNIQ